MLQFYKLISKYKFWKWQISNKLYSIYTKSILNRCEFTLICNNCYAGHVYEVLNKQYNTPTIGLYFFAEDYIKFITNFDSYLNEELKFIKESRYKECHAEHIKSNYPIGILSNNLEIHFLHYKNELDAFEKWERRKKRIIKDRVIFIMNDQNRFCDNLMIKFDEINAPKIFFSSKARQGKNVKVINLYNGKANVGDMYYDRLEVFKEFNFSKWIKSQICY